MKQEKIYLSIAGFVLEISFSRNDETSRLIEYSISVMKQYYKDFLIKYSGQKIDHRIEVVYKPEFHILLNKAKKTMFINYSEEISAKKTRTFYHVSGMQLQIIIRKITSQLLEKNNGFILHASAVNKDNKASVFLGESGAGKSTIMTILSPYFTPAGDDTVIIRKQEGKYYCYSSTAIEKNSWFPKNPKKVALEKVFFLRQAKFHAANLLKNKEKIIELLGKQVFSEKGNLPGQFSNMAKFVNSFDRFYLLDFSLKDIGHLKDIVSS